MLEVENTGCAECGGIGYYIQCLIKGQLSPNQRIPCHVCQPLANAHFLAKDPPPICPNCGWALFERKCKQFCPNRQCGYQVTCSEF